MKSAKPLPANPNRQVETPEGIILSMPLADPIARACAFAIDFLVRISLLILISLPLAGLGQTGTGIWFICLFVLWWGYYVITEMLMDGSSPGKKAMHLRVVNEDFTSINFSTSLIRNLLRVADAFPGFYGMAILTVLFSPGNKRLGDIAAKTVVVSTRPKKYREIALQAPALIPNMTFTQTEQRNIIEFARFCELGSTDRAKEIASHLAKPLNEENSDQLVVLLRRYAKWFLEGSG
ncbi:MAG: hypothetical protein CR975_04435 [Gammaproteobacteria bacterium]|nr:MAG: hypothetical protein CR975_04435 [Gammaproteobacteria bacterium]